MYTSGTPCAEYRGNYPHTVKLTKLNRENKRNEQSRTHKLPNVKYQMNTLSAQTRNATAKHKQTNGTAKLFNV